MREIPFPFIRSGAPLRVHHVSKITGLACCSVRWNVKQGRLPYYRDERTPKFLLFRYEDVVAFLQRRASCDECEK